MRSTVAVVCSVLSFGVACGSSPSPPPATTGETPAAPTPAGDAGAASASGDSKSTTASLDAQREPFIGACMKKMPFPDYCDCAWGEFKQVFKSEDLSKDIPPNDPRLRSMQERTAQNCSSKLTEPDLKRMTLEACVHNEKKREPYCECKWTTLRKFLAIADFVRPESEPTPRLVEAVKAIPKECKGKLAKDVVRTEFIDECAKNKPKKACECAWNKFSAKFSPEEIDNGLADPKAVPGLEQCNKP